MTIISKYIQLFKFSPPILACFLHFLKRLPLEMLNIIIITLLLLLLILLIRILYFVFACRCQWQKYHSHVVKWRTVAILMKLLTCAWANWSATSKTSLVLSSQLTEIRTLSPDATKNSWISIPGGHTWLLISFANFSFLVSLTALLTNLCLGQSELTSSPSAFYVCPVQTADWHL